jgi:hypothetical protein
MNVCVIQEDEGRIFIVSELTDHDALEMLAVGHLLFDPEELTLKHAKSLRKKSPLRAAVTKAMAEIEFDGFGDGSEFRLYCQLVDVAPDRKRVLMAVGLVEPDPETPWLSGELREYASKIVGMRRVQLANIAAKEALVVLGDDENASFLNLQSEVKLPIGLLPTALVTKAIPGNINGTLFSEPPSAPSNEEVLKAFLDRFKIDKATYEQLVRPTT